MKQQYVFTLLAVLATLVAGVVCATSSGTRTPSSVSQDSSLPELARALSDLRQEISALRGSLETSALASSATQDRVPAGEIQGHGAPDGRLALAIEALVERLEGSGLPSQVQASFAVDRSASPEARERQAANRVELRSKPEAQRTREHFLEPVCRIVDRYGVPDSVYTSPEGEVQFIYQENESASQIGFGFADGVVVRAWGE